MLPVVEYASVVFDGYSEEDKHHKGSKMKQPVVFKALLENLYKECGLTTLSQRRQQHKISFMYKVDIGSAFIIQDLIPPLVCEISCFSLKNNSNITVPFDRSLYLLIDLCTF